MNKTLMTLAINFITFLNTQVDINTEAPATKRRHKIKTFTLNYIIMKTLIITFFILIVATNVNAQVGINTEEPKTTFDVRATNDDGTNVGSNLSSDGVTLPRVNTLENPGLVGGQLVYLTENWGKYSRGTHVWDESIPDWVMLESPKGTANIVWSGKLSQNFVQSENPGGISSNTRIQGNMVTDMVDEFNMYDNTTGVFHPLENGVYRIEIKHDYTYMDIDTDTRTYLTPSNPTISLNPYTLYGLYDETAGNWIFRNYEYNLTDRSMGYGGTGGGAAGRSCYTIGYVDLDSTHNYAFYFVSRITDNDWNAGKRIIIAAQNSGTTGSSDATYFVLQKVQGL